MTRRDGSAPFRIPGGSFWILRSELCSLPFHLKPFSKFLSFLSMRERLRAAEKESAAWV